MIITALSMNIGDFVSECMNVSSQKIGEYKQHFVNYKIEIPVISYKS